MDQRPIIYLLPGLLCDQDVWQHQSAALSQHAEVRIPDFKGLDSLEKMADLVLDEAPEQFSVIGHSMGGGVATALAAGHPEMIDSLVIIDSGPVMRAGSAVEFERQLASLAQDFPSMAAARAWQHHALPNISDDAVERRLDARLVEQDGRVVWREDPRIRTSLGLIVRPSEDEMWKRFLSVKARTLFVLGGNSQLVTDEAEKRLTTEMSDAKSVRIANAGHNVFEDNHDDTMIAINGFLPG